MALSMGAHPRDSTETTNDLPNVCVHVPLPYRVPAPPYGPRDRAWAGNDTMYMTKDVYGAIWDPTAQ